MKRLVIGLIALLSATSVALGESDSACNVAVQLARPDFRLPQVARAIAKKNLDHSYTNVEFWSAIVLDVAEVPPALAPVLIEPDHVIDRAQGSENGAFGILGPAVEDHAEGLGEGAHLHVVGRADALRRR